MPRAGWQEGSTAYRVLSPSKDRLVHRVSVQTTRNAKGRGLKALSRTDALSRYGDLPEGDVVSGSATGRPVLRSLMPPGDALDMAPL